MSLLRHYSLPRHQTAVTASLLQDLQHRETGPRAGFFVPDDLPLPALPAVSLHPSIPTCFLREIPNFRIEEKGLAPSPLNKIRTYLDKDIPPALGENLSTTSPAPNAPTCKPALRSVTPTTSPKNAAPGSIRSLAGQSAKDLRRMIRESSLGLCWPAAAHAWS